MKEPSLSSREIARQAVRNRIQEVAERLFDERGFRETTVGDIAEVVGISERTFFRYFATKDDLLFSSFDADTQWAIDSVNARPRGENPWDSLHAVVEAALDRLDSDAQRRSALFQRITAESPHVQASYFTHVQAFHRSIGEALWVRWHTNHVNTGGNPASGTKPSDPDDRIILCAVVSSVFAAVNEVTVLSSDRAPAEQRRIIRATLATLRPSLTGFEKESRNDHFARQPR